MRVLFINTHYPMSTDSVLLHPPLAFAYMTPALKAHGHDVLCLDLPMRTNAIEDEESVLRSYQPELIALTCVTQTYAQALHLARFCKQMFPAVPIVIGGPHVTFTAAETLSRHQCIDYVLTYDADFALADLANALSASSGKFEGVPGLAYRTSNIEATRPSLLLADGSPSVRSNAPPPVEMDLDVYPGPDRSIFDMKAYQNHDYETVAMTARGCPSRCAFCSTTVAGRKYRFHGVKRVVDELEQLTQMGFSSFFIGDDTFPVHAKRTKEICAEILRRGLDIRWTCNMRVIDAARRDLLDAMVEAGAYRCFTGIETIRKESLKLVAKGTTPKTIRRAIDNMKGAGLEVHTAYIVGVPGDTEDDLRRTLDFIRDIEPTVATFNTMEVRPGTPMFSNPSAYGLTVPDRYWYEREDWMDLPACETNELSRAQIKSWVEKCYTEFCDAQGWGFTQGAFQEAAVV